MRKIKRSRIPSRAIEGVLIVISIVLVLASSGVGRAQNVIPLPPRSGYAPDLQVLVVGGMPGGDLVNITYSGVATQAQLQSDVTALASELNVSPDSAKISSAGLPEPGGQTPPMTGVTFQVSGAAPLDTGKLPVDKIILGLRNYHRLAITYILPPRYTYTGFHKYVDKNVSINVTQNGSNCSFIVDIYNPNMTVLTLPASDPVDPGPSEVTQKASGVRMFFVTVAAFLLICIIAVLAGLGAYRLMKRKVA